MPDPRAHRVLASVSRVAVLEVLRDADGPLGVQDLAQRLGLHANTVRAHLEMLAEFGHVRQVRDATPRRGRPRQLYTIGPESSPADAGAASRRNYRLLATVLAEYLHGADDPAAAAVEAGRRFGARLVPEGNGSGNGGMAALDQVVRMLAELGFDPEMAADRTAIRLRHCPFHDLAVAQPDVVCNVHLGLLRGALEQLGAPAAATRLIPFVTPRVCLVELGLPSGPPQR
jgi:predicted ArsR family transcriptional regulator